MNFIDVISFISTCIMLGLHSPGCAEADLGCGENLKQLFNSHLCHKYF